MDAYLKLLKEKQLKITPRRKAVIDLFVHHSVRMRPYDVYAKLKNKLPRLGLPTIYRILEELLDAGILIRLLSSDRQRHYALCAFPGGHHHHFTCRKCRKVEEVEFCNLDEISVFVENKLKAKVEAHQLQIEGLCSRCK